MTMNAFRRYVRAEETMIRASMPKTNAVDPTPLPAFATDEQPSRVRWSLGRRFETKAAFTFAEVAHV